MVRLCIRPYGVLVGVGKCLPIVDARVLVAAGEAAAAVQNGTQGEFGNLLGRRIGDLRLDHLADLLFDAQAPQALLDIALDPSFGRVRGIEPFGARLPSRSYLTHRCLHLIKSRLATYDPDNVTVRMTTLSKQLSKQFGVYSTRRHRTASATTTSPVVRFEIPSRTSPPGTSNSPSLFQPVSPRAASKSRVHYRTGDGEAPETPSMSSNAVSFISMVPNRGYIVRSPSPTHLSGMRRSGR